MATFTVYVGRDRLGSYTFEDGPLRVGRAPDSEICINLPTVSRKHATIRRHGAQWSIEECGGANGVFVNGRYVSMHMLRNGDEIRISRAIVVFSEAADQRAAQARRDKGAKGAAHFLSMEAVAARLDDEPARGDIPQPPELPVGLPHQQDAAEGTLVLSPQELIKDMAALDKELDAHLAWFDDAAGKRVYTLAKVTTIGRGGQCDINLKGGWSAVVAATITREGQSFRLERSSRLARVLLKGAAPPKGGATLRDGDRFSVFGVEFRFKAKVDR